MSETSQRRVRRSRAQWQQLIDEQARSGESQATFCASRGISVGSFRNWKRRLTADVSADAWLELGGLAERGACGWDIELDLGDGVCLRLRRC